MISSRIKSAALAGLVLVMVAGCGNREYDVTNPEPGVSSENRQPRDGRRAAPGEGGSLFDIFRRADIDYKVNRFLWTASLDVLNFLPIQSADPFTGVITTGYGTPPGGGRAYRATILISDPALDARSLNVALQTRSGPVAAGTQRAVEDAILNRARQLRINAAGF